MRYAIAFLLLGTAYASETVTFGAAGYCPTYCTQFETSDPAVDLQYIAVGQISITINGVIYSNRYASSYEQTVTIISATYPLHSIREVVNVPYTSADGRVILATIVYDEVTRQINSGRTHGYLTKDTVLGGSLVMP